MFSEFDTQCELLFETNINKYNTLMGYLICLQTYQNYMKNQNNLGHTIFI